MVTPERAGKINNKENSESQDEKKTNERILDSGDCLTIETINDFVQQLRSALAEADTVTIDFRDDVELDITALQVFCSACQTAAIAGKKIVRSGHLPETLQQLAIAAGSERRDFCKIDNPLCFRKLGGFR